MNFEAVIGLEIHVQMKTKSKMFSSSPVSFSSCPNTNVSVLDLAFPGAMPTINKQAVINAIRVCSALKMNIDNELWFDRKNYFYSDLPKGYQITQKRRPIGCKGELTIKTSTGEKIIHIERLHLEEDTCKQVHEGEYTYLDFNRNGIPLIEIVSYPEFKNGEEAMIFIEKIRSIVSFLDVSDGKMENGSLRVDVNVSIMPIGSNKLGTKVEIKNINTLLNIQKAIDYEISRQEQLLLSGGRIEQETRRYDEKSKHTVLMRVKKEDVDYKYFAESNILPIKLSDEFIKDAIESSPELAEQKKKRYLQLGIGEYESNILVSSKAMSSYFENTIQFGCNPVIAANWILGDIQYIIRKQNITLSDFAVSPERLAKLIKLIENKTISNNQARDIMLEMLDNNDGPELIVQRNSIELINDENVLLVAIKKVLDDNQQLIIDYKSGKDRAVRFVVGAVIKMTQGKANPKLLNELVIKEMKEK